MKSFIPIFLLFSLCHAADIDSVFEMRCALQGEGLNDKAVKILLKHANLESHYGTKGVAVNNGFNWWNCTTTKSYKGKKRIAYEWEKGRRVKKYWYVWETPQEASEGFVKFLRRRYRGAMSAATRGDWQKYMRILRMGGYFGKT